MAKISVVCECGDPILQESSENKGIDFTGECDCGRMYVITATQID